MNSTTVYMYAKTPNGTPCVRVLGNLRPTESALNEIKEYIQEQYDTESYKNIKK